MQLGRILSRKSRHEESMTRVHEHDPELDSPSGLATPANDSGRQAAQAASRPVPSFMNPNQRCDNEIDSLLAPSQDSDYT